MDFEKKSLKRLNVGTVLETKPTEPTLTVQIKNRVLLFGNGSGS